MPARASYPLGREAYAGGVSSVLELIDAERTHLHAHLRGSTSPERSPSP